MGFLWSEVQLDLSPRSLRYYSDLVWYMYSLVGMIPLFYISFYKLFINKVDLDQLSKEPQSIARRWDDYFVAPFLFYGPIYFTIDVLISLYEGSVFEQCRFASTYHHIISIFVVSRLFLKSIYYWWELLVAAMHAVLVIGGGKVFVYIYVMLVILFNYNICVHPYNKTPHFQFIGKYFPFMYYSFILVLFYDCKSPLPAL